MKILSALFTGDIATAALNLANTAGMITLKALPSDEIRKILIDLHKAKILARSNRKANKLERRDKMDKIREIERALRIARKHKLDLSDIKADLQRVLDSVGD